ncbi:MAG TPA: competence/damage-inducible protein A [Phycisphaerae bacterium]|nr:competence/damage-inducible protein A [Phycisphaerae bacterium]
MAALVLSIGDELTSGLTANTNASWLSQQLATVGIATAAHVTVPDQLLPIVTAIREGLERGVELILITGGLGPTEDDLTRQALADALGEELVEDPEAVVQIERWFKARSRLMSPSNRLQALRPHSAVIIENLAGTAPGMRVVRNGTNIFVMPGVPAEMRGMFTESVLPALKEMAGERVTTVWKINTFGRGESVIGEAIKDLMVRGGGGAGGGNLLVGTTANEGIVSVRIYATATRAEAAAMTERVRQEVLSRLGAIVFGENEETIESAVARVLKEKKCTVASAESCTGGLLGKLLTDTAGSSAYFMRGWVTYMNASKSEELGVPAELIGEHGAVSEPVARAMAEGARKFSETDFALATTGIAGPDGGTAEKPVGTVWIAMAGPDGTEARRFIFPGDRKGIRLRASQMALSMLRWKLLGIATPI